MMSSKLKWLLLVLLLLSEQALCRVPPSLAPSDRPIPATDSNKDFEATAEQAPRALMGSLLQLGLPSAGEPQSVSVAALKDERVQSAQRIIADLREKLQAKIPDHVHIQENVSCAEMLSASTLDHQSSSLFPQELLGLSLVPVLVVAGCTEEAQTLVLNLYELLGVTDTHELLMEVEDLIERKMSKSAATPAPDPQRDQAGGHIEALMFNIQQLALVGEGTVQEEGHCEGWSRVNGTMLVGTQVEGTSGGLEEAVTTCERLGVRCAGVTCSGTLRHCKYQAVLRKGSRILPSESSVSECWIHQCAEEDVAASVGRMKRSPQRKCINRSEERVYNVVEWIPAVSTLYNLGTAVYYASVNCSETAKERAILSAVDLGTDALMVATGGSAGVAGFALGAGVKTGVKAGVKYLINSLKQEDDVLVNQFSWEEGIITVH